MNRALSVPGRSSTRFRFCLAALLLGILSLLSACTTEVVVERYEMGSPKTLHTYAGKDTSLQNLRRVQTFYFNNKPETDGRYRKGVLHGEFLSYWHNGQIKSQGKYQQGRKQGDWVFFYNKFSRSSEGRFVDDKEEGEWTEFFENGSPKSRGVFREGRKIGEWKSWNENGVVVLENSCFPANEKGNYRAFHTNGEWAETYACKAGSPAGEYVRQDPSALVLEKGSYADTGIKEGLWETFHPNGRPAEKAFYVHGLKTDSAFQWDEVGRVIAKGFFKEGTGWLTRLDSTGAVLEILPYQAGKREGRAEEFYPSGARMAVVIYRDDLPVQLNKWYPNGRLSVEGGYREGKRDGIWKTYSESGVLMEEAHFSLGQLHGPRLIFEEKSGRLQRRQEYIRGYPSRGHVPDSPSG